jgi:hypothetical protein
VGSNPGLHGVKPATNCLCYDNAPILGGDRVLKNNTDFTFIGSSFTVKLLKDLTLLEVLNFLCCIKANWGVMNEN